MADDLMSRLLVEQRKRLVAAIMNHVEQSAWWRQLRPEEQRAFRQKTLDSIGIFYDFCRDVIKVGNETTIVNEHALNLIQAVHESQRRLEATNRGNSGAPAAR